ncbi:MAG: hypothetical protein V2I38_08695, partial [Alcanivoracaceae bacterium]|nr:hypothetical protein [Alcanivoracaceae bacterium]
MMLRASPRLLRLTLMLAAASVLPVAVRIWLPEYQTVSNLLWLIALGLWLALLLFDIIRGLVL